MEQGDGKAGRFGDCSAAVIGACIEVHRELGPGLLESAYQECLACELDLRGLLFERERSVPVQYKGRTLECGYRLAFVVEGTLIVEIKCVDRVMPIHEAQLLTYLRLTGLSAGLLLNFRESTIKRGLRRLTLSSPFPSSRLPVNLSGHHDP
jgi:GxxExxY protein